MARRAHGVRKEKRTGRYQARYIDVHGRRRSRTFDRQRDAVQWLRHQRENDVAAELGEPAPHPPPPSERPLFSDFAGDWLKANQGEWSKATRTQAERIVRLLKESELGRLTVDELDFRAVESYLNRLASRPGKRRKDGKGKPPGYYECRNHMVYLRRITKRMQVEYGLPLWACETVHLPKSVRRRRGVKRPALTAAELAKFLDVLDGPEFCGTRWRALFWTLALTGMRPAEALALRRNRIDFDRGRVVIDVSAYRGELGESTKTGAGREPAMVPALADVLRDHLKLFPTLPSGFLFPSSAGGPARGDTLSKPFRRIVELAEVNKPGLTTYSLRNTFDSIGEQLFGSSLALRDTLGHVGADMTELYKRTTLDERRQVAEGFTAAILAHRSPNPPVTQAQHAHGARRSGNVAASLGANRDS